MVLKSEACCPKCFVRHQFVYRLRFNEASNEFVCSNDASHVFVEGEDGYLKSKV